MQQFFQFIILTFVCSSTCFGRFPAHNQELNDCSGSLWFYLFWLLSQIITKQCKFTCNCNPTICQFPPLVMFPYIPLPLVQHRYSVTLRANCKWRFSWKCSPCKRVGTLIVATIYSQLIQSRYMFWSFTVLQCSHQHFVQPVVSDVEVVGYL
jgi:hypothetical protein